MPMCGPGASHAPCVTAVKDAAEWRAIAATQPEEENAPATLFFAPTNTVGFANAVRVAAEDKVTGLAAVRARLAPLFGADALSGTLLEREVDGLGTVYLYDVRDDAGWSCEAHEALHARLAAAFTPRPLYRARLHAEDAWNVPLTCELPTFLMQSSQVLYEPYTVATAYGTVRTYRTGQLAPAAAAGDFGWQNILVLEQTPFDVETIIAGAITGTRQGQLSHLNIRSAARGTPNCFVRDAYGKLSAWEGKLVKVTCGQAGLEIGETTVAEAEAWRMMFRPKPQMLTPPDETAVELVNLLQIPTATREERALAVRRYGAKAANLATLYQRIRPALTLQGFAVPIAHQRRFARETSVTVGQGAVARTLTIDALVGESLADPDFLEDGAVRRLRLGAIREAIEAAPCPRPLLDEISRNAATTARGVAGVFRFRSSSNAEDLITFSGAGLYTSQAGCVADDLDVDDAGPSLCDAGRRRERRACDAIRAVWSSLWALRAYEERAWAGIRHEDVGMGVLVNDQSEAERVNMVVFSGDPTRQGDRRLLVDAQIGTLEVVAPEEGTWPEQTRLTIGATGDVTAIDRIRRSSALAPSAVVLTDDELRALGAAYAEVLAAFPNDGIPPEGREVIFDSEWKVLADGRLIIKQIRPFLR